MLYVALLRGINVGGKNKVDMKKLKSTFESLGYSGVVTYINSGNIIFETPGTNHSVIAGEIESAIHRDFQLEIKVLIRSAENIALVCREIPAEWVKNEHMRTDVLFLWENYDSPDTAGLLKAKAVDNIRYVDGAIVWNINDKDYSKSALPKLMGTVLYKNMTIRNINTVRALHQLMSGVTNNVV